MDDLLCRVDEIGKQDQCITPYEISVKFSFISWTVIHEIVTIHFKSWKICVRCVLCSNHYSKDISEFLMIVTGDGAWISHVTSIFRMVWPMYTYHQIEKSQADSFRSESYGYCFQRQKGPFCVVQLIQCWATINAVMYCETLEKSVEHLKLQDLLLSKWYFAFQRNSCMVSWKLLQNISGKLWISQLTGMNLPLVTIIYFPKLKAIFGKIVSESGEELQKTTTTFWHRGVCCWITKTHSEVRLRLNMQVN